MMRLWISVAVILATLAAPAGAAPAESRVRLMAQPSYWSNDLVTLPVLGLEAEVGVPDTAWTVGGVYTRYFSRYKVGDDVVTLWDDPPSIKTLFGRYSSSSSLSWLVGLGAFRRESVTAPTWQWNGAGLVLGVSYRPSWGPLWLQIAPNVVVSDFMWSSYGTSTQRFWSLTGMWSGLSWLEVGVRPLPNVDLAFDPLTRTLRTSWIF